MSFAGGAPAVVSRVMSLLSETAAAAATEAKSATQAAVNRAVSVPQLLPPRRIADPAVPQDPNIDFKQYDPSAGFSEMELRVVGQIDREFKDFLQAYFPTTLDEKSTAWLGKILTVGGTGVSPDVEDQIWRRDRQRIEREAGRLTDEATTTWATRGYALPPGALLHQTAVIESEAQEKITESSRERAIKTFETELENIKFALNKVDDLRTKAMTNALAYIGATLGARQMSGQVAGSTADFYSKLSDSLISLYRARSEAELNVARIASANEGLVQQGYAAQLQANTAYVGHQVNAAMAGAQMLGTRAAAALNGLHAQASVSGSDITNISL